jgi:hypothetical protein
MGKGPKPGTAPIKWWFIHNMCGLELCGWETVQDIEKSWSGVTNWISNMAPGPVRDDLVRLLPVHFRLLTDLPLRSRWWVGVHLAPTCRSDRGGGSVFTLHLLYLAFHLPLWTRWWVGDHIDHTQPAIVDTMVGW